MPPTSSTTWSIAGPPATSGPIMTAAATTNVVHVHKVQPVGGVDPEHVVTPRSTPPSIYADRVVEIPAERLA